MTTFATEEEEFWAGQFGDEYASRNRGAQWVANNTAFFARVLQRTEPIRSVIEFGANIGLNLQALRLLLPGAKLAGVEINEKAVTELRGIPDVEVHRESILHYTGKLRHDLVVVKGVLIHLHPESLPPVYDLLHRSCERYICLAEYYNPTPVTVPYRGHTHKLFKRDFAGEMLDRFSDLQLMDYGFVYRRDPHFPQDDLTWFLLRKGGKDKGAAHA